MSKSFTISLDMLKSELVIKMRLKDTFAAGLGDYCKSVHITMPCSRGRGRQSRKVAAGAPLPVSHSLNGVAWSEEATRL